MGSSEKIVWKIHAFIGICGFDFRWPTQTQVLFIGFGYIVRVPFREGQHPMLELFNDFLLWQLRTHRIIERNHPLLSFTVSVYTGVLTTIKPSSAWSSLSDLTTNRLMTSKLGYLRWLIIHRWTSCIVSLRTPNFSVYTSQNGGRTQLWSFHWGFFLGILLYHTCFGVFGIRRYAVPSRSQVNVFALGGLLPLKQIFVVLQYSNTFVLSSFTCPAVHFCLGEKYTWL